MTFPRAKFSFTTMGTPGKALGEVIALARHHGFSGVDLRCSSHLGEVHPDATPAELDELGKRVREAGLEIPSLLCYPESNPSDRNWETRLAKELARLLEKSAFVRAHAVRIFGPALGDGEGSDWLEKFIGAISAALADSPPFTRLLIQNHRGGSTVRDCVKLAWQLNDDRFKIAYSPDHGHAYDSIPVEEQWGLVAPHTGLIYLSDLRRDAQGFRPALPGHGEVPLTRTMDRMFALGFDGYCSFKWEKIWHDELPEFEVAAPHFFRLAGISRDGPK